MKQLYALLYVIVCSTIYQTIHASQKQISAAIAPAATQQLEHVDTTTDAFTALAISNKEQQAKLDGELLAAIKDKVLAIQYLKAFHGDPYGKNGSNFIMHTQNIYDVILLRITKALEAGANPNIKTSQGVPALFDALKLTKHFDHDWFKDVLLAFFKTGKLDINMKDHAGNSILRIASSLCSDDSADLVAMSLALGAKSESKKSEEKQEESAQ